MFYGHNPLGAEAGALQSSRLAWTISQDPASTNTPPLKENFLELGSCGSVVDRALACVYKGLRFSSPHSTHTKLHMLAQDRVTILPSLLCGSCIKE